MKRKSQRSVQVVVSVPARNRSQTHTTRFSSWKVLLGSRLVCKNPKCCCNLTASAGNQTTDWTLLTGDWGLEAQFSPSLHLLDLVQVTVDVISCGRRIQILFVLFYLFFYEVSYILVDALHPLVWPRQTPHQARKRVVKLWSQAGGPMIPSIFIQ